MSIQRLSKPAIWGTIILATTATIFLKYAEIVWYSSENTARTPAKVSKNQFSVSALGHLVPQGQLIHLSASPSLQGAKVASLMVKEGQEVKEGEIVAILDSRERLAAALEKAQQHLKVARAQLKKVEAGASQEEIEAQKAVVSRLEVDVRETGIARQATITRLEAELENAKIEYHRYERLYQKGAISARERDRQAVAQKAAKARLTEAIANRKLTLANLKEELKQARATLTGIQKVRPEDLEVRQAEVDEAIAAVRQAKTELDLAYIRSPQAGQVLQVYTRSGEIVSDRGIVEIGNTEQMEVIAQVDRSDISKVYLDQKAIVTSEILSEKLNGTVTRIGSQVSRENIIEVKISLDREDSKIVKKLTNLPVQVALR
ncbi:MAG: HlyD family efflux transporter periplasmic adaptor subunit [Prochloraceae cyanobacterium]|nr:HlyD family efflux transporter periplasmic adaptor subunit [Prochloraceae cyanobacterium]